MTDNVSGRGINPEAGPAQQGGVPSPICVTAFSLAEAGERSSPGGWKARSKRQNLPALSTTDNGGRGI